MEVITFRALPGYAGRAFLAWAFSWWRVFHFGAIAIVMAASPSAYDRETRNVMARQIYFTAWQILPGFMLVCALSSYIVIRIVFRAAETYGQGEYALSILVRLLVLELIPLFVALFVALRSGSAVSTEIVLMHIRGDMDALQRAGADPMRHELVPRVVGGTVSVVSLTVVGCIIALSLAYVAVYGLSPWGLEDYTRALGQIFTAEITFGVGLKSLLFSLAVAVIPIVMSLNSERDMRLAPIAVLRGMVRLFLSLLLIEGASLAVKYI